MPELEGNNRGDAAGDTADPLEQFIKTYKSSCADLEQTPSPIILDTLHSMLEKRIPSNCLSLSGANLPDDKRITDQQVFALFECMGHGFHNNPFATIDLSHNRIGNSGAKAIAVYLTQTVSLQQLFLQGNNIAELGASKIAQALYGQATLKTIDLSCNPLGNEGGVKLAETLLGNSCLLSVNVGCTDMGQEAIIKFATVLNINETIEDLNLDRPILFSREEETTIAIAKALKVNTTLKKISLQKFGMTDHGAEWIADNIVNNTTLEYLDLSNNSLTQTIVARFVHVLGERAMPTSVNLNKNNLYCRDIDEIEEAIYNNDNASNTIGVKFTTSEGNHSLDVVV